MAMRERANLFEFSLDETGEVEGRKRQVSGEYSVDWLLVKTASNFESLEKP